MLKFYKNKHFYFVLFITLSFFSGQLLASEAKADIKQSTRAYQRNQVKRHIFRETIATEPFENPETNRKGKPLKQDPAKTLLQRRPVRRTLRFDDINGRRVIKLANDRNASPDKTDSRTSLRHSPIAQSSEEPPVFTFSRPALKTKSVDLPVRGLDILEKILPPLNSLDSRNSVLSGKSAFAQEFSNSASPYSSALGSLSDLPIGEFNSLKDTGTPESSGFRDSLPPPSGKVSPKTLQDELKTVIPNAETDKEAPRTISEDLSNTASLTSIREDNSPKKEESPAPPSKKIYAPVVILRDISPALLVASVGFFCFELPLSVASSAILASYGGGILTTSTCCQLQKDSKPGTLSLSRGTGLVGGLLLWGMAVYRHYKDPEQFLESNASLGASIQATDQEIFKEKTDKEKLEKNLPNDDLQGYPPKSDSKLQEDRSACPAETLLQNELGSDQSSTVQSDLATEFEENKQRQKEHEKRRKPIHEKIGKKPNFSFQKNETTNRKAPVQVTKKTKPIPEKNTERSSKALFYVLLCLVCSCLVALFFLKIYR